jgi:hypothetical protein
MTSFTKTTGVRRKGVKAGSTQGPTRAVTTVITGEAVKEKPTFRGAAFAVREKPMFKGAAQKSFRTVQELDKKFSRGGYVSGGKKKGK